jgi:hypothetical protein
MNIVLKIFFFLSPETWYLAWPWHENNVEAMNSSTGILAGYTIGQSRGRDVVTKKRAGKKNRCTRKRYVGGPVDAHDMNGINTHRRSGRGHRNIQPELTRLVSCKAKIKVD